MLLYSLSRQHINSVDTKIPTMKAQSTLHLMIDKSTPGAPITICMGEIMRAINMDASLDESQEGYLIGLMREAELQNRMDPFSVIAIATWINSCR